MHLRVLGCSGGSAPDRRLSSYLIDDVLTVDAGALTTGLDVAGQRRVEAVLLTHGHLDHVWSLPLFLANRFEGATPTCQLVASAYTLETVRAHLFNDRIWPDFTAVKVEDRPLLDLRTLEPGENLGLLERYDVTPIALNHTVPSQAYHIRSDDRAIIVCGDTCTTDALWQVANDHPDLRGILVECSWTDDLVGLAKQSLHMTPSLLTQDLAKLETDVPVYVMHRKPGYEAAVQEALEATGDKRLRFLSQDDEIDL